MGRIVTIIILGFVAAVFIACNKPISISEKVETLISENKFEEAIKYVRPLATQGNPEAQYKFCGIYSEGLIVAKNYKEAFKWCQKSANQDFTQAQFSLGSMYSLGQGIESSNIEAYKWFTLAIAKNSLYTGARDALEKSMTKKQIAESQKLASKFVPE